MDTTEFGVYESEAAAGGRSAIKRESTTTNTNNTNTSWFVDRSNLTIDIPTAADGGACGNSSSGIATIGGENNSKSSYSDLRNLEPDDRTMIEKIMLSGGAGSNSGGAGLFGGHDQRRDDDGYGSQTISVNGGMDPDEFYIPHGRERCNTWPRSESMMAPPSAASPPECLLQYSNSGGRTGGNNNQAYTAGGGSLFSNGGQHHQFLVAQAARETSNLSLIKESNESLSSPERNNTTTTIRRTFSTAAGTAGAYDNGPNSAAAGGDSDQQMGGSDDVLQSPGGGSAVVKHPATPTNGGGAGGYKSGHPSYVELITQAIHSSPEQRMTLSEIYDWMVANVQAFKDQRYLHSSSGWKNSVRHNLSLHSRFKRVKRNGMDKPSWWTVDLSEEVKRERHHHGGGGGGKRASTGGGSTKQQSAAPHCRPRANTTVGIFHQRPSVHQQQPQSQQATTKLVRTNQQQQYHQLDQSVPAIHQQQTLGDGGITTATTATHSILQSGMDYLTPKAESGGFGGVDDHQHHHQRQAGINGGGMMTMMTTMAGPAESNMDEDMTMDHEGQQQEWAPPTTATKAEITDEDDESPKRVKCLSQAITVTLRDLEKTELQTEAGAVAAHADVAFTMVMGSATAGDQDGFIMDDAATEGITTAGAGLNTLVNALRRNTLEDTMSRRQLLCVQNSAGRLQHVAVPVPVPIRVILRSNKACQTDDQQAQQEQQGNANGCWTTTSNWQPMVNGNAGGADGRRYQQQQSIMTGDGPGQAEGQRMVAGNQQQAFQGQQLVPPAANFSTNPAGNNNNNNVPLPDDLATLDVQDALDCNIMEVLQYEMNCY